MPPTVPSLDTLVCEAIAIDSAAERAAYLARACGPDVALRRRAEVLVSAHFRASESFLERPPGPADETAAYTPAAGSVTGPGEAVGPYKLSERLGEGGMGEVWVAEQTHPVRRRVAVKLIKAGMDTREVVARFEAERQALALMDHSHIARVFDGGTAADGRPYFVMELVRGLPLTDYCDAARLPADRRLRLFAQVCRAVQHAHQKGVIHRDLKPSNVLVTLHDGEPVPKVIDFGIAKATAGALTDRPLHTGHFQLVGTPLYMAPEQAELSGLDIDTRADVYSLGVLLYELLTGTTPFDREALQRAGFDGMRRIIRQDEPPRPSARVSTLDALARSTASARRGLDDRRLARLLRGDLDWVVMTALEKDRTRRYESAGAFAADVDRFLADQPVLARPPSTAYRLRKFARRHRAAVTAAALVAAAVLLGGAASAAKYVDERAARREADGHRQAAERHADEAGRQAAAAVAAREEADRQRQAMARRLYVTDMRHGPADWAGGDLARVIRTLARHTPPPGRDDPRGWEWYYLLALCHPGERPLLDVRQPCRSAAWSPDGRLVAVAGQDGTARVWDTSSWRLVRTLDPCGGGLAWSPDGRRLALGELGGDATVRVRVWDVRTDAVKELRGHTASIWAVAWSPDGTRLVSAGIDHTVRVWEPTSGWCLRTLPCPGGNIGGLAWSPDGRRLAAAIGGHGGRVWDAADWRVVRDGLTWYTTAVGWSPDGTRLAVGTALGDAHLFRTDDWSEAARWGANRGGVSHLAWSPDGQRLASAGADSAVNVWRPGSPTPEAVLRGHRAAVRSVAWAPDGQRLVTASQDGTARVWPAAPIPQPRRFPATLGGAPVLGIGWGGDPDTLRVYDFTDGAAVHSWDVAKGERLARTPVAGRGHTGQFGPGAELVGVSVWDADGPRLHVSDARTGRPVQTLRTAAGGQVAFSPDGGRVALARGGTLEVVDLSRAEVVARWDGVPFGSGYLAYQWSPDGRLFASGGGDGHTHVFDVGQRKQVLRLPGGGWGVGWSPDGRRLATGDVAGRVEVWEVPAGRKLVTAHVHPNNVLAVAWSPDGRRLATAGSDRTVRLLDAADGEELLAFDTPGGHVTQLRWSPDGRRLAAAGDEGAALVWDATAGYRYPESEAHAREQARADEGRARDLWAGGRRDEAIAVRERTLARVRDRLGPDDEEALTALHLLATASAEAGRLDAAERLLAELADRRRRLDGPRALRTAAALAQLGQGRLQQLRYADAEPVLRECLAVRAAREPDRWPRFNALSLLGGALLGQGRYAEAEPLLVQGYEGMKQREASLPPGGQVRLTEAGERLVRLYALTNRADQAGAWRAKRAAAPASKP